MDPVNSELSVSTGSDMKAVVEEDRNWRNRLRLRKAAVQLPTMLREDKHGPRKITLTENEEKHTEQTCSMNASLTAQQSQYETNISGNNLMFRCSECKDNTEFSPNDLLRHFKKTHRGSTPFFPCEMCSFITHEFSCLQVHLLDHRNTFVSCNICNDNVQRTLSELTTHLNMNHSMNGHYSCEKCKFSTRGVEAFLEHMYLHNIARHKGGRGNLPSLTDMDLQRYLMAKAPFPFSCQYCDYEAPQKVNITKHMATVHGKEKCQRMKEVGPKTDASPRPKHTLTRTTRSAVREMHWMSQGCLSLPGREFLDKYCSLSNPERALQETQQFLEKSVAVETDGQKWSQALKTVLSNVPQDITPFSKSENDVVSSSGFQNSGNNLTVLTVKNNISVPQNGTSEAIGFKMVEGKRHIVLKVTPSAKQETIASGTCSVDSHCTFNAKGCQSNSNIRQITPPTSFQGPFLTQNDVDTTQIESAQYNQSQENRDNQELRVDQEQGDNQRNDKQPQNVNHCEAEAVGVKEPKLPKKKSEEEQKSSSKALPSFAGRKKGFVLETVDESSPGLKLLLKNNPVQEMQWMSQGPLPLLGSGLLDDFHRLAHPQKTLEETQQFFKRALSAENCNNKLTKAPKTNQKDTFKSILPLSTSEEGLVPNPEHVGPSSNDLSVLMVKNKTLVPPNCTTKAVGTKMVDGIKHLVIKVTPLTKQDLKREASLHFIEKVCNTSSETCTTDLSHLSNSEIPPRIPTHVLLKNTNLSAENTRGTPKAMDEHAPDDRNCSDIGEDILQVYEGARSHLEGARTTEAQVAMIPPFSMQSSTSLHSMINLSEELVYTQDVSLQGLTIASPNTLLRDNGELEGHERTSFSPTQNKQAVRGKRQREPSSVDSLESQEASPAAVHHWEPAPRHMERTLKLLPLNPTQLIKRPKGDQPVVVLNHPDADIPEVTNIMEKVHRYNGEVQMVVLSQTTLNALTAMDREMVVANSPANTNTASRRRVWPESSVKERFILKVKLKKMSRKKYEVVKAISHCAEPPLRFSCWFCGRVFDNQEMWIGHGQHHLMESTREWDKLNCEMP